MKINITVSYDATAEQMDALQSWYGLSGYRAAADQLRSIVGEKLGELVLGKMNDAKRHYAVEHKAALAKEQESLNARLEQIRRLTSEYDSPVEEPEEVEA